LQLPAGLGGGTMLTKCANPNCSVPVGTFGQGRLFQFEIISISISVNDAQSADFDERPKRETSHFWLCRDCSTSMTLTLTPARGLQLIPLKPEIAAEPGRRLSA
jgi:hypothetical protein